MVVASERGGRDVRNGFIVHHKLGGWFIGVYCIIKLIPYIYFLKRKMNALPRFVVHGFTLYALEGEILDLVTIFPFLKLSDYPFSERSSPKF